LKDCSNESMGSPFGNIILSGYFDGFSKYFATRVLNVIFESRTEANSKQLPAGYHRVTLLLVFILININYFALNASLI
jgi:hypothetical protein